MDIFIHLYLVLMGIIFLLCLFLFNLLLMHIFFININVKMSTLKFIEL
jgi:hypothetical protein